MKAEKRTPPAATDGAQNSTHRVHDRPHVLEYSGADHAHKPKNQRRSAKSLRKGSRYHPGTEYRPSEGRLARRQREVLDLLKERGSRGATRLDAPPHLSLSLSQRICELRMMGHQIDTVREQVGQVWVARYVLVATEPIPQAEGRP